MYINTYIQNILKRVQMTICKAKIETEVESGHMDTAGVGESGADWGSSTAIYVLLCVKQLAGSSARHSVTTQRGHTYIFKYTFQAGIWSGLPRLPPRDLPDPEIKPPCLTSSALAGRFFTTRATQEAVAFV